MLKKLTTMALVVGAIALVTLYYPNNASANLGNAGFKGQTLVKGTFEEFDVFNKVITPASETNGSPASVWLSLQKTKGQSDIYIQTNTWDPGGSTGWHTHPGHSLILIYQGTVTEYEGDDPTCTPHVYTGTPGNPATLVDPGGDHVHVIRNEGTVQAKGYAIQIIPAGATRRIDGDAPSSCASIQ